MSSDHPSDSSRKPDSDPRPQPASEAGDPQIQRPAEGSRRLPSRSSGDLSPYYGVRPYGLRPDEPLAGGGYGGGYIRGYYGGGQGGLPNPTFAPFSISRLLRTKWLMLACFLLISGAVVPWIWVLHKPEYESQATLRIYPMVSYLVFRTENNGFLPLYHSYVNTQVAIMRSPKILERVLDRQKVQESQWYREGTHDLLGNRVSALSRLLSATSVRPRGGTELVDVKVTVNNPDDAKLLADSIIEEHLAYVEETLRENESWLIETLQKEHTLLLREIDGLNAMRYNLAKKVGVLDVTGYSTQLRAYVSLLEADLRRLERGLDLSRWEIERLSTTQPADLAGTESPATHPAEKPDYDQDPERRRLTDLIRSIGEEIEIASLDYGPDHPRIKRLKAQLAIAERERRERDAEIDALWERYGGTQGGVPNTQQRIQMQEALAQKTEYEIALVKQELSRQQAHLADISDIALELTRYEEEITNKRSLADAVRKRLEALDFEGRHAPARVKIASYGMRPAAPSTDRRAQLTMMTLAISLMVSLALGYVRSTLDRRIYEVRELQQVYRAPFLGVIPSLPTTQVPRELGGTLPLATTGSTYYYSYAGADSCQSLMESIRMVRTALLERLNEADQRVVLITSSVPRTGKSSVAVLLARSLALLNRRVLLIEADLRHPTLAGRLNISTKKGLASLLTGAAREDEVVIKTDVPNLDVIIAGEIPEGFSSEMLANAVFTCCLERWKQQYDFCLLDSPPILPVADARILARCTDGTIMVLRASHDMRHEAMEAYAQLSAAGGLLLGTVFIGDSSKRSRPYMYGYAGYRGPLSWQWRNRYSYHGSGYSGPRHITAEGSNGNEEASGAEGAERKT